MNDETRKLLKIFGIAVTDFEAEAEKLAATAAQLSSGSSRDEVATLMQDAADLSCRHPRALALQLVLSRRAGPSPREVFRPNRPGRAGEPVVAEKHGA
jgi:hypothetical protein